MSAFDASQAAALIVRHNVSHLISTDLLCVRLLEATPEARPFPSVRFAGFSAFTPSITDLVARGDARGVPFVGLYGSSEIQALFAAQDPADPPEFLSTSDKCKAEKGLWANAERGKGFCIRMQKAQRQGSGSVGYGGGGATVGASAGSGKGPEMMLLVFGDAIVVLPFDIPYTQTEEECVAAGSQWWDQGDGVCVVLLQPVRSSEAEAESR